MTAAAGADAVAVVAAASDLPAAVSVATAAAELVHLVGAGGALAAEEGPNDVGVDGVQREGVFVLVDSV